MFDRLQIYDPRERLLVGVADRALSPLAWLRTRRRTVPRRVLLLRLERIGDLLMVLDAIHLVRTRLPTAEIDLVVGSWNAPLAALIPDVTHVEVANAPWLARGADATWGELSERTRDWRGRYDLVINFEPDIRSNLIAWMTRAPRRVGYWTGGGGPLLTEAYAYEPARHVSDNARQLVARALDAPDAASVTATPARLDVPADARDRATALLGRATRPLVGVHTSGGRESKQWHVDRFADVARRISITHDATIVLTGTAEDRPLVERVRTAIADRPIIDVTASVDLPTLAAVLEQLDVLITGDTGPMHLAAAVGTPVVALFGPSDPNRYGPIGASHEVIRIDLWCSPCGQVRLPPLRCRGHVPDCLDGISVDRVVEAVTRTLARRGDADARRAVLT